jgi:hypothetical protein
MKAEKLAVIITLEDLMKTPQATADAENVAPQNEFTQRNCGRRC